MKVCIILPCNLYNAPYSSIYFKFLLEKSINYDLIYWDRDGTNEMIDTTIYKFSLKDKVGSRNLFKVFKYIRFARFAHRILRKNNYDKIIILGSYAGIMALLSRYLKKQKHKYLLDIRDYTFENINWYYKRMKIAIENSFTTVISSKGYEKFLPQYNYVLLHNYDSEVVEKYNSLNYLEKLSNQIRISYIGLVGFYDENIKLINILKNDDRFILQFYGKNSEYLKNYCELNGINNVDFIGRFDRIETAKFYKKTDIINNNYGNNSIALTTALSNKLYFSMAFNMPILVSKNTFMEEITTNVGNGFVLDFEDKDLANHLYEWYNTFDFESAKVKTNIFLDKVKSDNKYFHDVLMKFLVSE